MTLKRLNKNFFTRSALYVAPALLGKLLVRQLGSQQLVVRIVEVEAYTGFDDRASHASRGLTKRTALMFGQAGLAYIYLIYGMYFCFNVVTDKKGFPAAVLIRAAEPLIGLRQMLKKRGLTHCQSASLYSLTNGPGKLCQALDINSRLNGLDITTSNKLFIADDGYQVTRHQIRKATRIGVEYAGPWQQKLWRFYLTSSPCVSKI